MQSRIQEGLVGDRRAAAPDPVEVRRGPVGGATSDPGEQGPEQLVWRGRLWKVRSVLAHSVVGRPPGEAGGQLEVWRVEAGRGSGSGPCAVLDLICSGRDGSWELIGFSGGRGR